MFSLASSLKRIVNTGRVLNLNRSLQTKYVKPVFEPLPKKRNGQSATEYLHQQLLKKHDPTGRRTALVSGPNKLRAGDLIRVSYLDRTEVIGRVIGIKRGQNNLGANILVRNRITNLGCEMRIPLFSPNIKLIELIQKPERYLPKNKHYYIRNSKYDVGDLEMLLRKQKKLVETDA